MKSRSPAISSNMLARVIAEATGCTKARAELAMQKLQEQIIAEMKAGNEVRFDRMGAFHAKLRPAYEQIVPFRTGGHEKHQVPAMLVPRFRPLPALKRALAS